MPYLFVTSGLFKVRKTEKTISEVEFPVVFSVMVIFLVNAFDSWFINRGMKAFF